MEPAIKITGLTKRFGHVAAVDHLDLEVPEGSIFGFLGANGAGKTTTLRLIAGLARPTSGSIEVGGHTVADGPRYRRQIGYLPQEPAFYGWMTGREVVRHAAGFYPELRTVADFEVERLLSLVGLSDAADRRSKDYSGGMRQRLGIAAALVGRPRVLLLDEPATGLDPLGRRDVLELMGALRESTTIFYSTHILDDVQRVSDRVAVIDHGKLLVSKTTDELVAGQGHNSLRVELIGATPATADELKAIPGVSAVSRAEATPAGRSFQVQFTGTDVRTVQEAITRFASNAGLTVVEARPIHLDLEEVFLRLVDNGTDNHGREPKETAA